MGVRIQQIDLQQPLPTVHVARGQLWILVKFAAQPLGWVKLSARDFGNSIAPEILSRLIADQLSKEVHDAARNRAFKAAGETAASGASPGVSIVVCTQNNPAALERHLASLVWLTHPRFEVIVVDNAPNSDATAQVCSKFRFVHRVVEPRPGLAYARNTGWQVARNDIVAYTDDNTRVDPHWLIALTTNYADPRVNAVAGLQIPAALDGAAAKVFAAREEQQYFHRRLFAPGAWNSAVWLDLARISSATNFSIRRSAIANLSGFDPALDRGGVLDLFTRLLRDGAHFVYEPGALTFDQRRQTSALLQQRALDFGYSLSICCSKFFNDTELANTSAVTLRRWIAEQGIGRFKSSLGAALRFRPHVPLHLILLELAGAALATKAYRRSLRHVKNDITRFRQKGIARRAA